VSGAPRTRLRVPHTTFCPLCGGVELVLVFALNPYLSTQAKRRLERGTWGTRSGKLRQTSEARQCYILSAARLLLCSRPAPVAMQQGCNKPVCTSCLRARNRREFKRGFTFFETEVSVVWHYPHYPMFSDLGIITFPVVASGTGYGEWSKRHQRWI